MNLSFMEWAFYTFSGSATATVILGFLAKYLLEHRLSKEIKEYESKLQNKSSFIQNRLNILLHKVKLEESNYTNKRISALENAYSLLLSTDIRTCGFNRDLNRRIFALQESRSYEMQHIIEAKKAIGSCIEAATIGYQKYITAKRELEKEALYLPAQIHNKIQLVLDKHMGVVKELVIWLESQSDELESAEDSYVITFDLDGKVTEVIHKWKDEILSLRQKIAEEIAKELLPNKNE